MRLVRLALTSFLILGIAPVVGCSSDPAPDSEMSTDAPEVVGGRAETGYPAVGYLAVGWSAAQLKGPNCGVTLIGERLAVTAAHCIVNAQATSFGMGLGRAGSSRPYPAKRVFTHPEYQPQGPNRFLHDIAVLVLEEAPAVRPAALFQGEAAGNVRYVGYGRTTPGDATVRDGYTGERKGADLVVSKNDALAVYTTGSDGGLCWGDSGGPILTPGGEVVGVLADFDGVFQCSVGNRMIFSRAAGERRFLDAARRCAESPDASCLLREYGGTSGGGGGGACAFPCAPYNYGEGQCAQGWRCTNGCLAQSAACATCQHTCAQYGYGEGLCANGWRCTGGCLAQDASCRPTCQHQCGQYGYREGMCLQGWLCAQGCMVQDARCGQACTYSCGQYGYAEGQCYRGFQCRGGCLVSAAC
jgi:hypothetical protein